MSYGEFLGLFLGLPILGFCVLRLSDLNAGALLMLASISLLALAYTGPWDNLIVSKGVWSYGKDQVLGLIIGRVPVEEYAFYVLQVFLTGMLTLALLRRR